MHASPLGCGSCRAWSIGSTTTKRHAVDVAGCKPRCTIHQMATRIFPEGSAIRSVGSVLGDKRIFRYWALVPRTLFRCTADHEQIKKIWRPANNSAGDDDALIMRCIALIGMAKRDPRCHSKLYFLLSPSWANNLSKGHVIIEVVSNPWQHGLHTL